MLAQTLSVWSGHNRSFQAGVASFCWFLKSGNHPNFSRKWRGRRSPSEHHPLRGGDALVMTRSTWWHKVPCPNVITPSPILEFILRGLSETGNPTLQNILLFVSDLRMPPSLHHWAQEIVALANWINGVFWFRIVAGGLLRRYAHLI